MRNAFAATAAISALLISGCSNPEAQALAECQALSEEVLTWMAHDYPQGPKGEEITQVELVTVEPLECRGRLFYSNAQVATVEYDHEFYRTSEGSATN